MSPQGANQSKQQQQQQPEPVTRRIYVGGLSSQVTAEELAARFQPFGRVDDCYLPRDVLSGGCRGFGYVSLTAPEEKLKRCLALYNGSKWKGMHLRLEKAKEGYMEKLRSEREANSDDPPRQAKRKWPFVNTSHSEDMTLANDKNIGERKGWKHGRFGRAVAVMRMRKPGTSSIAALDPTIYKTNITKLFGTERPKDVSELTWRISDDDDDRSDESSSSDGDESDDGDEEPVRTEAEAHPADKYEDRISVIEDARGASPGAEAVAPLWPECPSTDALSSRSGTVDDDVPLEGNDLAWSSDTGVDVHDDVSADPEESSPIAPDAPSDYADEADYGAAAVKPTRITFSDYEDEEVEGKAEAQAVVDSTCEPLSAVPAMQKSKKTFKVDESLADVFRPGTELGKFSLFGHDDLDLEMIEEEEEELEAIGEPSSSLTARNIAAAAQNPPHAPSAPKTKPSVVRRETLLAPMSSFFFYFNDTGRSSNIAEIGSFKRTESPEEIKATWESYRQELTSEFKRKHKSGVRKRARFLRSGHTTEEAGSAAPAAPA